MVPAGYVVKILSPGYEVKILSARKTELQKTCAHSTALLCTKRKDRIFPSPSYEVKNSKCQKERQSYKRRERAAQDRIFTSPSYEAKNSKCQKERRSYKRRERAAQSYKRRERTAQDRIFTSPSYGVSEQCQVPETRRSATLRTEKKVLQWRACYETNT